MFRAYSIMGSGMKKKKKICEILVFTDNNDCAKCIYDRKNTSTVFVFFVSVEELFHGCQKSNKLLPCPTQKLNT